MNNRRPNIQTFIECLNLLHAEFIRRFLHSMETETMTIAVISFFTFALFLFWLVHFEPKRGFIMFTVKFQEIKDKSDIIPRRAYFLNQFFHGYD